MGKLNLLAGTTAVQQLRQDAEHSRKNREAEEGWVRKNFWGYEDNMAEEEMGDNITLGDTTTNVFSEKQGSSLGKNLALAAGLGAAGLGLAGAGTIAGLATAGATYYLTRDGGDAVQAPPDFNDNDTKYGIRIIKD